MRTSYEQKIKIPPFECDMNGTIHLARMMGHMQEIANAQLTIINLSYEKLAQDNMAFLLSSVGIKVNSLPKMEQEIVMTTYPEPSQGAKFYRTVIVKDTNGSILLVAKTVWLLVDIKNRKILRPNIFLDKYDYATQQCNLNLDYLVKYKKPKNYRLDDLGCYKVRYSDIDVNNHVNNAKYIEIVLDALPAEIVTTKKIDTVFVGFTLEAKLNDVIKLDVVQIDENIHHIVGTKQEQDCFYTTIHFI
ncbi:MAG: thioesterase [Oscillospiraceae bacterium]